MQWSTEPQRRGRVRQEQEGGPVQQVTVLGGHVGRGELSRKSRSVELNFTAYMAAVAKLHGCGRRIEGKVAKRCARAEGVRSALTCVTTPST